MYRIVSNRIVSYRLEYLILYFSKGRYNGSLQYAVLPRARTAVRPCWSTDRAAMDIHSKKTGSMEPQTHLTLISSTWTLVHVEFGARVRCSIPTAAVWLIPFSIRAYLRFKIYLNIERFSSLLTRRSTPGWCTQPVFLFCCLISDADRVDS